MSELSKEVKCTEPVPLVSNPCCRHCRCSKLRPCKRTFGCFCPKDWAGGDGIHKTSYVHLKTKINAGKTQCDKIS